MKVAIIGAGMAGLTCASTLAASGHTVSLFDKGRGPGGRMSTRRLATPLGDVSIDHGAQYFTARDSGFRSQVASWCELGIAASWPLSGTDAWIGTPGMNGIIRHMAQDHDIIWAHTVLGIMRDAGKWWLIGDGDNTGPFDAVLLAIPAEQAAALLSLHDFAMARVALMAKSQPCWTSMLVFDRPLADLPPVLRTRGTIGWAARNNAKPGRAGPEAWVVQASPEWSLAHIEATPDEVSAALCAALAMAVDQPIPKPVLAVSHRWRYAMAAGTGDGALWNADIHLGACGDWLLGPRIECAWLSGRMLAERIGRSGPVSAN